MAASAVASPIRSALGAKVADGIVPVGPYDAEVEYLESTGTQYIDTGVKLSSDHVVSLRGKPNNVTSFFELNEANKMFNLTGSTGVSRFYY